MAGITALSASVTMTSGDTAVDKTATGYIRNERVTLGTYPLASSSYLWSLGLPSGSSAAKAALTDSTSSTPAFTPDIGGTYTIGVTVDGTTTYAMRLTALDTAASEPAEALRFTPRTDAQVGAPSAGVAVYYSSTQTSLSEKDSAGTVSKIATTTYVDERTGGSAAEYGEIYWSTPAATTLVQNVWTKAAGTTTLALANDFTMPANNRLRHDDSTTEIYLVSCDYTITSGANNQVIWVGISKGGADPVVALRRYRLIATGADAGMGAVAGLISLAATEYVELWVMNATGSNTVTVQAGALRAVKVV